MQETVERTFSYKLRSLTAELRMLDGTLRSNAPLDSAALREFRHALDNVRLTAWTANELLDARRCQKDLQTVMSFLALQRLRRFSQMVEDLCSDFDRDGINWSDEGIKRLAGSLGGLCERLGMKR